MSGKTLTFAVALLLTATPVFAAGAETHSGTLIAVDPAQHTLTLEEMGPWRGNGSGLRTESMTVTPATRVALVRRSMTPATGGWPGSYVESPLAVVALQPGDFVDVQVSRHGTQLVAESIDVVRPSND